MNFFLLPLIADFFYLFSFFILFLFYVSRLFISFRLDGVFLLAFELLNILFEDFNLFRLRVNGQTQLGGCLVNQVNRLIRQKRSLIYRAASLTAASSASFVIVTL